MPAVTVEVSADARRVYDLLNDEQWMGYVKAREETGWSRRRVRAALRELSLLGFAHYGPACNEDGVPSGSGWWRTHKTAPWESAAHNDGGSDA